MITDHEKRLLKSLQVLRLCLHDCTQGSAFARNPYLRSPSMKKKLQALHEAIVVVIQDILINCADMAKVEGSRGLLQGYYGTYAFLFGFHEDITKEEYDHRILTRDPLLLAQFQKLFLQSESVVKRMEELRQKDEH